MDKFDFKREQKALYFPETNPTLIRVPAMRFIMVDGRGDPNDKDGEYAAAVGLLYALTYTIKMKNKTAPGYLDYIVPPLEGLWSYDDGGPFRFGGKEHFIWTMMIRQPEFVSPALFEKACLEVARKKPATDVTKARLTDFEEGLCIQCLHNGPYDTEPGTVAKMDAFIRDSGLTPDFNEMRRHHEIYLGDPRKTEPSKLKTVLRHPVRA